MAPRRKNVVGDSYRYKRKTTRQSWSQSDMLKAIAAVKNKEAGYLLASKIYCVPKSTLERRVKGLNKLAHGSQKILGNQKLVLPVVLDDQLAQYVLQMEECLFGLTCTDVRKLAYTLAVKNGYDNLFNSKTEMAGYHWYYGFLRRHPEISLRKPENTSVNRSRSFNRTNVDKFFTLYKGLLEKHNFPPNLIYNCDEKGLSTVPNAPPKVLSRTGKKQVGTMSSAERGTNTTVLLCGNATGDWVPPLFVFPRKKNKQELLRDAPEGSVMENQKSGWMTNESFHTWLQHFINYTGVTKERQGLLILDGHVTHVKSLECLLIAKEHGLHMICLPPHCTHRMQPLDVTCMGPLEINFSREVQLWLRNNPGQTVSLYYIAGLFGKAYEKVVRSNDLVSGFRKCGLWPLNTDVFDNEFRSAHQQSCTVIDDPNPSADNSVINESEPCTPTTGVPEADGDENDVSLITPEDIAPIPVIEYKKKKASSSRQGKTAVVTSSPYIKELSLEEENRNLKEQLKVLQKEVRAMKKNSREKKKGKSNSKGNTILNTGPEMNEGTVRIENVPGPSARIKKEALKKKKKIKIKKQLFKEGTEDELPTAESISNLNVEPGTFVLVRFVVREKSQFYAGYIRGPEKEPESEMYEVKFLRRRAVKDPCLTRMRFYYPEEDDIKTVSRGQMVLSFDLPDVKKSSKRQASMIFLEHDRLGEFQPVY